MQVPELSQKDVSEALENALATLAGISTAAELRAKKAEIVGEGSALSKLNSLIKSLPNDQKAEAGKLIGGAKAELQAAWDVKESLLAKAERAEL